MDNAIVTSLARGQAEARLRISVIVTNHNYGHFLGACLGSLRAQTRAADEVIVVDDGSKDGSRAYLAQQSDIRVILQENGGQAAAFNSGFAASTGEAVLFLDADDVLNPEALSVIETLWSDKLSGLFWAMDTIDAQGVKTGRYPMRVPDVDLLPRLMDGLTMPFMPTSGNIFAREAIAWAFPLPEQNWQISADAILIRVAVVAGPLKGLPHTLGGYRIHGANNYYRGENTLPANTQRGLLDVVKAGLDLLEAVHQSKQPVPEGFAAKVLGSALRQHLRADSMAPDPARRKHFLATFAGAAWKQGVRIGIAAEALRFALPKSKRVERWITEPVRRPRGLQLALRWVFGENLLTGRYSGVSERAPFDGPPQPGAISGELPLVDHLTSPVWERKWPDATYDLRAAHGGFTITRAPGLEARLRLWLTAAAPEGANVRIFANGLLLARRYIQDETEVVLTLLPSEPGHWQPDHIEIEVDDARKRKAKARRVLGSRRLTLGRMVLMAKSAPGPDAVLPITAKVPVATLGTVLRGQDGSVLETDHTLIGPGERLALAMPALAPPFSLSLKFAPDQGEGMVSINAAGRSLYTGRIGPSQEVTCFLPPAFAGRNNLEVAFPFEPDDILDGAEVALASLAWLPGGAPWLSPGEHVGPACGRTLHGVVGEGWQMEPPGKAKLLGPVGELALRVPLAQGLAGLTTVTLDLEALAANAFEAPPLVVVAMDDAPVAEIRLAGRADVEVAIPGGKRVELAVHVAGVSPDGAVGSNHGGIMLHGLRVALDPVARDDIAVESVVQPDNPLALLRAGSSAPNLALDLAQMIEATAPKALWHLLEPRDLDALYDLGTGSPQAVTIPPGEAEGWLKHFALSLLGGADLSHVTLASVPDLPEDFAMPVAKLLVKDPGPQAPVDGLLTFQRHLAARLEEARAVFAETPRRSARRALANHMITQVRANGLLFSDFDLKPHIAAFGRALETRLTSDGHILDLVTPVEPGARKPRVGIIVRDLAPVPETWILKGMLEALPASRADVTVFLTQATGSTAEPLDCDVVSLAGLSVPAIVSAIRAARLDSVLLGAAFHGYMPDAEIAAHRLAPRQITFAATQYATTGLRAVDEMVFGELQAPEAAQADCTEEVVLGPGTGQIFRFGAGASAGAGNRKKMRADLGLDAKTVMLTSGAMADKIGSEVLTAWVAILAQCDDAVLVLYPFAANWYRDYDREGFAEAARAACVAAGVDPERVKILPPLGSEGVRDALAAADVYLVAFPYSGATTTLEALLAGVPCVARTEVTQRGHQAASWLEAYGLGDFVGAANEDYTRIAVDLVKSKSARSKVTRAIKKAEPEAVTQAPFIDWLGDHVLGQEPRYVFHHIPKTAGTSFRGLLGDWFEVVAEYPEPWGPYKTPPVDLDALTPAQMLVGHYWAPDMALFQRYPDLTRSKRWRILTFLRDPLEKALSEYFFEAAVRPETDPDFTPMPLDDFIRSYNGMYLDQFGACEATWREMLDRYWFVGSVERFPECVAYLARSMGKSVPKDLPTLNQTPRKETPTEEAVTIFKARNAVDYAIYEEVNRRLDHTLKDGA